MPKAATQSRMDGRCSKGKEGSYRAFFAQGWNTEFYEKNNSHRELQENDMGEENRAVLGLSIRGTWVCHSGTNSGSPVALQRLWELQDHRWQWSVFYIPPLIISVLYPPINFHHLYTWYFHLQRSVWEQVTVSRNLSIKASLLLL